MQKKNNYKKTLAAAMSCFMIASNVIPAFADSQTITENGNAEIEVVYNQASSFSVTIPKAISLDSNKQSDYSVKVSGDIAFNQEISVTPIDEITDTEAIDFYMADQTTISTKENVIATINQNKTIWSCEDVTNNHTETENRITASNLTAGEWKGIFEVEIKLITHETTETPPPEVSIAPATAYLNWNYTLNNTDNTITLNYYKGTEKNVIVYGNYEINGTIYKTRIKSNDSNVSSNYMFANKKNIESITFKEDVDTSDVTNMSFMFWNSSDIKSIDLKALNTKQVTNMSNMFCSCMKLTTLDLGNFNTSKVTDMSSMFSGCSVLESLNLDSFDTCNVTTRNRMFSTCYKLTNLNLENFDTRKVTNMMYMFFACSDLESLNLDSFDTSEVTTMARMFASCPKLTKLDLSNFDNGKVTDMVSMFEDCTSLETLDLSSFNTCNTTNMNAMFYNCSSLTNLNLNNFNTTNVIYMNYMFYNCSSLEILDLSSFDTSNIPYMSQMFADCTKLKTIYVTNGKWNTSKANTTKMFNNCGTSSVTYI